MSCEVCKAECGALRFCDDECRGYAEGRAYGERETVARVVAFVRELDTHNARFVIRTYSEVADLIERGGWKGGE